MPKKILQGEVFFLSHPPSGIIILGTDAFTLDKLRFSLVFSFVVITTRNLSPKCAAG